MASYIILLTLLCCPLLTCIQSQLDFTATTPKKASRGKRNTFIGMTGNQIATSLLTSNTPALLWGSVPSSVITKACNLIVSKGTQTFKDKVKGDWGGTKALTLKLVATGGCGAAKDSSGTQFVFTDNYKHKSVVSGFSGFKTQFRRINFQIVCPNNAGRSGCGVYMTGNDINNIYKKRLELANVVNSSSSHRQLLGDCQGEAGKGTVTGPVTGILGIGGCLGLGPLSIFCAAGVIRVNAGLGAAGGCVSSCFPGNALVELATGETKLMSQLLIGDKVVVERQGQKLFQDVYAFGHKDPITQSNFVRIIVANSKALELSSLHFVPTLLPSGVLIYKRAQDVNVGDTMLVSSSNDTLVYSMVNEVSAVVHQGLFNPLTLEGTIIINGVVASMHSDWFLDGIFDRLGVLELLPAAYQLLLLPARVVYALLGKENYVGLYNWLDAHIGIDQVGTKYGAQLSASTVGIVALAGIASKKAFWH